MESSIDLFLRLDQHVVESPWRVHRPGVGCYRSGSLVACIMKYFSKVAMGRGVGVDVSGELALADWDEVVRFQRHLAGDMKVGRMDVSSVRDLCKFFNVVIRFHDLAGHVDIVKPRGGDVGVIATIDVLFDGEWFELLCNSTH